MKKLILTLTCAAAAVSLYGGNLVLGDSSFETEPDTLTSGKLDPGILPFVWDDKEAFHGKRSLRIDWDRKNRNLVFRHASNFWVDNHFGLDTKDLENDREYTFSFYAKADADGVPMGIWMWPNAGWEYSRKGAVTQGAVTLTKEWKRYSKTFTVRLKGKPHLKGYTCMFGFNKSPAGKYWIDAVQVEPGGKMTPYQPSTPMHCGVRMDVPPGKGDIRDTMWAIYYAGDKITGVVRTRTNDGKGGKLTVRTIDWRGNTVSEFTRDNVKDADIPLTHDPNLRGWFKTVAAVTRDGKEIVRHSANYMVIDRPVEIAPGIEPFFGIIAKTTELPIMKRIGVRRFQIGQPWRTTHTAGFEYEKGKYDFRAMDARFNAAKEYGMKVKISVSQIYPPEWYFDPKLWAEAKKYPGGVNGLISKESAEAWKKRVIAVLDRYGAQIDTFELGGEDDGRLGANAYYKAKHPDWVEDGKVCKGEAFNFWFDTVAEMAQYILKRYPEMKVSVVRPSEGRKGYRWIFCEKMYDRIGKSFNHFGIDCYMIYPYNLGPDIKGHDADIDGREWTWNTIQGYMKKNRCKQQVFMSEASLQCDTRYPDESKWQRERAELQSKDFLISRALGFYAYDLFNALGGYAVGKYTFTMQQNHQVQIALPAVCQSARLVENSVKTRYIRLPGAARITLFKKHDGSGTAGIWADQGYVFQPADAKALTVMDMMGNPMKPDKNGKYELGLAPVLISGPKYEAMENAILKGEIAQKDFCRLFYDVKRKDTLTFLVENTSNQKDLKMSLEVRSDAGTHSKKFTVPVNGYRGLTLPAAGKKAEVTLRQLDTNAVDKKEIELAQPIRLTRTPVQFADASIRAQILPDEPWVPWSGPDDFSARCSASWTEQYLQVDVVVTDDRHFAVKDQAWNCDSVQIALDPKSRGGFLKKFLKDDLNKIVNEVCVALDTKTGKQKRFISFGNKELLDGTGACTIVRDEAKKQTRYRLRIPWEKLGVKAEKGLVFGMSLVLFDDDTGTGKETYTRIGGGITGKKNPREYLKFVLE